MDNYNQHHEMFKLLTHEGSGVLATLSLELEGYPFGSVTPYCLDGDFIPNILISGLAQHTKNILKDSRVSLTIVESAQSTNKQAKGRLTYVGDAVKVEDDSKIKKRYLNYFPSAKSYFETHDFFFFKILPKRLRFIGGFGKIYWIESEELKLQNIFEDEKGIVDHMNDDHESNLRDYCSFYLKEKVRAEDEVRLCGLDQFGIDLSLNQVKRRIEFNRPLTSPDQARAALVEMAKESKQS